MNRAFKQLQDFTSSSSFSFNFFAIRFMAFSFSLYLLSSELAHQFTMKMKGFREFLIWILALIFYVVDHLGFGRLLFLTSCCSTAICCFSREFVFQNPKDCVGFYFGVSRSFLFHSVIDPFNHFNFLFFWSWTTGFIWTWDRTLIMAWTGLWTSSRKWRTGAWRCVISWRR